MIDVDKTVREFSAAHHAAEENTDLLLEDAVANTALCVERMERLEAANEAVLSLACLPNLPLPVVNFINADKDKGCDRCWFSSRAGSRHAECQQKIDRWFDAERALIELGDH